MNYRFLVVGNSLTEGIIGIGYLEKLIKAMPNINFENLGLGGDTLIGIGNRLIAHLKKDSDYDGIIIEAGHNDIVIPYFEEEAFGFKMTALALENRGSIPVKDPEIFIGLYASTLKIIQKLTSAKIFITTLSTINEDQTALTAMKRKLYNKKILSLSTQFETVQIVDIGYEFDLFFQDKTGTSYLLTNYFKSFFSDKIVIQDSGDAKKISDERRLSLTIDGVHLNDAGANMYFNCLYNAIRGKFE